MKIDGVEVTPPAEEVLVLPRGQREIVLRAKALQDMDKFDELCPPPKPPGKLTKDGWVPTPDDPGYKSQKETYNLRRLAYMVIHSLEPSNIEWSKVDPDNPKTWTRWDGEMRDAGFTQVEVNRILQLVIEANRLDESKLEAAREAFLRGQALAQSESCSPSTEQGTSPSGEPANDSE